QSCSGEEICSGAKFPRGRQNLLGGGQSCAGEAILLWGGNLLWGKISSGEGNLALGRKSCSGELLWGVALG
ncbi:MAG TPA: hypothetical protein P5543_01810, partial [Planctomycetota bacterium]|nr:hypothetical protein [Planctomycetota bacterium]